MQSREGFIIFGFEIPPLFIPSSNNIIKIIGVGEIYCPFISKICFNFDAGASQASANRRTTGYRPVHILKIF